MNHWVLISYWCLEDGMFLLWQGGHRKGFSVTSQCFSYCAFHISKYRKAFQCRQSSWAAGSAVWHWCVSPQPQCTAAAACSESSPCVLCCTFLCPGVLPQAHCTQLQGWPKPGSITTEGITTLDQVDKILLFCGRNVDKQKNIREVCLFCLLPFHCFSSLLNTQSSSGGQHPGGVVCFAAKLPGIWCLGRPVLCWWEGRELPLEDEHPPVAWAGDGPADAAPSTDMNDSCALLGALPSSALFIPLF